MGKVLYRTANAGGDGGGAPSPAYTGIASKMSTPDDTSITTHGIYLRAAAPLGRRCKSSFCCS